MRIDTLIAATASRPLTGAEAEQLFDAVMDGRATFDQMHTLLSNIRRRGAVPDEVAGGVQALRKAMIAVEAPPDVVDTCGTGGGALTTFNISTAAALVAAGAGVRIAKHGNRSYTSRCGSADVLERLGVPFDLPPDSLARVLEEAGIVFMFAPHHHPAMRHVAPVRKALGVPTLMNVLGPLTNPARAKRQVVGVSDPGLLDLVADGLARLGHHHALVVHGEPGIDELSPLGLTHVREVREGTVTGWSLDPRSEFGWRYADPAELAGGSPEDNADRITRILRGGGPDTAVAAVALNAGAALYVAGRSASLQEGVLRARELLRAGSGWAALERLRAATERAAGLGAAAPPSPE